MQRLALLILSMVSCALGTPSFASDSHMLLPTVYSPWFTQGVELLPGDDGEEWTLVYEQGFIVPRGTSYSPTYVFHAGPAIITALRVELLSDAVSICDASVAAIDVAHVSNQNPAVRYIPPDADGVVQLVRPTVFKLVLEVLQPHHVHSRCMMRLYARPAGAP